MSEFLIYGANGYTGSLIAREAVRRGHRPILAGRNSAAVASLAQELQLDSRSFPLDNPALVIEGLQGVKAVIHCAGPFAHTARAMADGCLWNACHYLDITGEIGVFLSLLQLGDLAKKAGVMLLPGAGFDVVPTDCLAAHLKRRLPSATRLALAIQPVGGISRGTATTAAENLPAGARVRKGGTLTCVPLAWKTRAIDFGNGPVQAITIPWGDVVTAYHSTGIPDIEVYLAAPLRLRVAARASRYLGWLLASSWAQKRIKARIRSGPPGPTDEERARGASAVWGEAADDAGGRVVARLHGPEAYTMTVHAALAAVERVLRGEAPPGFQTPATAYGPDFVLELPGVKREDIS
jgi:short subunit dehydrogenase-like uncharacterized protein